MNFTFIFQPECPPDNDAGHPVLKLYQLITAANDAFPGPFDRISIKAVICAAGDVCAIVIAVAH